MTDRLIPFGQTRRHCVMIVVSLIVLAVALALMISAEPAGTPAAPSSTAVVTGG